MVLIRPYTLFSKAMGIDLRGKVRLLEKEGVVNFMCTNYSFGEKILIQPMKLYLIIFLLLVNNFTTVG